MIIKPNLIETQNEAPEHITYAGLKLSYVTTVPVGEQNCHFYISPNGRLYRQKSNGLVIGSLSYAEFIRSADTVQRAYLKAHEVAKNRGLL